MYYKRFYAVIEDKDTLVEYLLSLKQELDNLELDKLISTQKDIKRKYKYLKLIW